MKRRRSNTFVDRNITAQLRAREACKLDEERLAHMQRDLYEFLLGGGSTGDLIRDFALLACNGMYDEVVVEGKYRPLQEHLTRHAGERTVMIQVADGSDETQALYLHRLCLAEVRAGHVLYDKRSLTIFVPVVRPLLRYEEVLLTNGTVATALYMQDSDFLQMGPLLCAHTPIRPVAMAPKGYSRVVAMNAPGRIYWSPLNYSDMLSTYSIPKAFVDDLSRRYVRALTRRYTSSA